MLLIYTDESGNTGARRDPSQPIHLIAGLIVDESQVRPIEDGVDAITRTHFGVLKLQPQFELHGADLFSGNDHFKGVAPAARIAAISEIFDLLAAHETKVIWSAINKLKSPSTIHPHQLAFKLLMERIEDHLRSVDKLALIVADENKEIEQRLIDDLTQYKQKNTGWGWRPTSIDHVIDSVHFVQSFNNKLIQCADLVAYFALKGHRQNAAMMETYSAIPGPKEPWPTWMLNNMSQKQQAIYDLAQKITAITQNWKLYPT